jgi:glycosyltransferase involved in cell wall biosynthesis
MGFTRVSVLIPTYNGSWCIARTLRSVQRQTLDDFEAIIVDDGSTDGTAEVARSCVAGDRRFRVLTQANAGVAAARNRALAEAKGLYAAPLDHDDLWEPAFLAEAAQALDRGGEHAVMAFARSVLIDAQDRTPPQAPARIPSQVDYRELLRRNPIGNGSAMVARTDALRRVGFDVDLVARFGQADDWWTQLQLSWLGEVIFIDAPLIKYRITPGGASNTQIRKAVRATIEVLRRARRLGPRLAARDYWDAQSLALTWQARRAKAAGQTRLALTLAAVAYAAHPLWILEPELRDPIFQVLAKRFSRKASRNVWRDLLNQTQP